MANVIKNIILTMVVFVIMVTSMGAFSIFMVYQVYADDYSPLDFTSDYQNFEARVGVDKNLGRYFSYHYVFNE